MLWNPFWAVDKSGSNWYYGIRLMQQTLSKDLPEIDQITFKGFLWYLEQSDPIGGQISSVYNMRCIFGINRSYMKFFQLWIIWSSSTKFTSSTSTTLISFKYWTCRLCRTVNMFSKSEAIRNQRDVKLNFIFSSMCSL